MAISGLRTHVPMVQTMTPRLPASEVTGPLSAIPGRAIEVSFEFFPPTNAPTEAMLWESVRRLAPLHPRFMSVTYGASGSTCERTPGVVHRLQSQWAITVAPHLTCVGATRERVLEIARTYWAQGITHLVALRGDEQAGSETSALGDGRFETAVELVRGLKDVAEFDVSVSAYPEVHPQARSAQADLDVLKAKAAAGANRAISQFFFHNDTFLRFRDRCVASGIHLPIVPGILPVTRLSQVQRFAQRCGTRVPDWLVRRFEGLDEEGETARLVSAAVAIEQTEKLRREGVREFHFYTLNRAEPTYAVCHALGLRPQAATAP